MEFCNKITKFIIFLQNIFLIVSIFGYDSVVSRDTITADNPLRFSETIISNSQNFKMELFSPENSKNESYVGIMFNVPSISVVWVANRGVPMKDSRGIMGISEDGNLVVWDGDGVVLWSTNVSISSKNTTAQLLDTGNLVLRENSSQRIVWESFGVSSDTLIEKMKIGNGENDNTTDTMNELRSWKSPSDPSPGNFSLRMQTLDIPQIVVENESKILWRSGPWNKQVFIGLEHMNSLYKYGFQVVDDENPGGTTYLTFTNVNNSSDRLHYVLNSTGCFLEKSWDQGKGQWLVSWDSCENGKCDAYGKCGPFGICDPSGSQVCSCMQGYKPRNETDWGRGCVRDSAMGCNMKDDGFLKMEMVKVPDFARWVPALDDDCEAECLRNCSCVAYAYDNGVGCMHWSGDLIDVQQFSEGGADLYIRLSRSELDQIKGKKHNKVVIVVVTLITIVSLAIALCLYFGWGKLVKHKGKKQTQVIRLGKISPENKTRESIDQVKLDDLPVFSFEIIAKATDNFHSCNKLGQGGFGQVYKGKLEDGQEIAVKRLSESSSQGQNEFINEVMVISKLQHRNLVRLLGCCIERGEKMLVYEFMPNGSLDSPLFDPREEVFLDWTKRFTIIEGIGRGLLYLHRDSRLRIIHRDLKTSNILLDEQLNPKISDFGLARIFEGGQHHCNTQRVVGTYGYMAPEYLMNGTFSEKSDVYSFGVLLLEIISGKKNSAFHHDEFSTSLVAHAWKLWNEEKIEQLVDPKVYNCCFHMNIRRCVHVGLLCVQEHPNDRPNVSTILSMLSSEIAELPRPKQLAFTQRLSFENNESAKQNENSSVNIVTITEVNGR